MTKKLKWLPDLILFEDFNGNWISYENAIYNIFKNDFINSQPFFQGQRVGVIKNPLYDGKESTFWHLISEGNIEDDRTPNIRRCERIKWPRSIIESGESEPIVKIWNNQRGKNKNTCLLLSFENENYLIVLLIRKGYFLLKTAYQVDRPHQLRKITNEYNAFKAKTAS